MLEVVCAYLGGVAIGPASISIVHSRMAGKSAKNETRMNLSCGNCKTIRSFSGQPLACDKCGWVCVPGTTQSTTTTKPSNKLVSVGAIVGFVLLAAVALGMLWGLIAIVKWMWIHS
jgi:hypothetical protein